jgi:DNA-binding beta-propeller fold protein YncE
MRPGRTLILSCALTSAACGGGGAGDDDDDAVDAASAIDAAPSPDASGCPRAPAAADRPRKVVVSHPYTAGGAPATRYRVLDLAENGVLTTTATSFEMGRSFSGEIVFTPDGEIGLVAQDDGSLGVFRFDAGGLPQVVHAAFTGGFYADQVVMSPDGATALVLDNQWRENGGGVHRVAIGCDGTLTDLGLWFPAKLPAGLNVLPGGERAVLAAVDVGASAAGLDAHLLDWPATPPAAPAVVASADAFADDEHIVGSTAITPDGAFALIGDNQGISETPPNRVAVVAIDGDTLTLVDTLSPILDPFDLVVSPHGDAALVVSGYGDALIVLDHDPEAASPFTVRGEPSYQGAAPELPGNAVMIEHGALAGLVLIAEVSGVRRVRFSAGAAVTDLGRTGTGAGTENVVGAVGVQP